MTALLAGIGSALRLGMLTSISPCPLASNIAAVSYVGRRVGSPRRVLLAGLAYSLGRALTYVLVAGVVVTSLLSVPRVSFFLQQRMNQVLGPLLMLAGFMMLGWIRLPGWKGRSVGATAERLADVGLPGAAGLGALCARSYGSADGWIVLFDTSSQRRSAYAPRRTRQLCRQLCATFSRDG